MTKEKVFEQCFIQWGVATQFNQAIEEFAEAIMAKKGVGNYLEEFVDSTISIENLQWYFKEQDITPKSVPMPAELDVALAHAIVKIRHFDRCRITVEELYGVINGLQASIWASIRNWNGDLRDEWDRTYKSKMNRLAERLNLDGSF